MKMMIPARMLKNIFMLFLSLSIATSCSKDSTSIDEIKQEVSKEEEKAETPTEEEKAAEEIPETETTQEIVLLNAVEFIKSVDSLSTSADALFVIDESLKQALSDTNSQVTFFVPSNKAFATFLDTLKDYANITDFDEALEKEILAEILNYHVIVGAANFSNEFLNGEMLETLQSEEIKITIDSDGYRLETFGIEARITMADIEVANGVVHIIDEVLVPESVLSALFPKVSVIDLINHTEDLSMFADAIVEAKLEDKFNDAEYTVFAPTNAAIEQLFVTLGDDYNSFADFTNILEKQALKEIILGHVVAQVIVRTNLKVGSLPTLIENDAIEVVESSGGLALQDASEFTANFIEFDMEASNGIIHTIDKILIPQKALLLIN